MSKKVILVLAGIFLFFGCDIARANVVINEVQIGGASASDEFIELYNSSGSDIDLSGWYINKKSSTGSESALVAKSRLENKSIPAGSYLLLARENGYVGSITPDVLWPGSYSLANNNSVILYKGNETDKDQISWENIENGKSIQKQSNGSWIIAKSTPRKANETPIDSSTPSEYDNSSSNTTETKTVEVPKIKTKITAKEIAFTGIPLEFGASAVGYSNESLIYGKYFWNFGDGDSKEVKANDTAKFTHTFFYEGEYTVTLQYFQNYYYGIPDASDRMTVKVIPPDITISKLGGEEDFFVEISNNTAYDADLSDWVLLSSGKSFTLPKNMILRSKGKITLSPKITNFSVLDKSTLELANKEWQTVFDYSSSVKPVRNPVKKSVQPKISSPAETEFPVYNLPAQALRGDADTKNNFEYGIFGLFAFVGLAVAGAYFIRRHNRKPASDATGNDFEILDE